MKSIIQRNLPLTDTYTIVSYKYISLIDGDGTCCENCGKLISNIVTLQNQKNEKFNVGNDCAETLTIDKSIMFFEVQPAFSEGKAIRAKILKHLKNKTIEKAYIYTNTKNEMFVVLQNEKGASSMQKLNHSNITIEYIKDLLTQ